MNHSQEIFYMIFVSDNQAPEVLKPGKQALDLPSAPIAPEFPAILGFRFFTSFAMRCNHFNTALIKQLIVKFIAVVCLIANQFIRGILGKAAVYRIFDKLYLMGRSAFNVSGDRKTSSVCDCHDLGAFTALCLADSKTPFFAGAKLPSMNASRDIDFTAFIQVFDQLLGNASKNPLLDPLLEPPMARLVWRIPLR
jgi:hypothetical protein